MTLRRLHAARRTLTRTLAYRRLRDPRTPPDGPTYAGHLTAALERNSGPLPRSPRRPR